VTLVLSREFRAGHEGAFEDALHWLPAEVRGQLGHIGGQPLKGASRAHPRQACKASLPW